MFIKFEPDDYSVVVKNRAKTPKPWRWEIYRAGRDTPVEQSMEFFETATPAGELPTGTVSTIEPVSRSRRATLARSG